jgi:hypothetical protein
MVVYPLRYSYVLDRLQRLYGPAIAGLGIASLTQYGPVASLTIVPTSEPTKSERKAYSRLHVL